eukprot:scaffold1403_cov180-Ochromonas_danica.AAC.8
MNTTGFLIRQVNPSTGCAQGRSEKCVTQNEVDNHLLYSSILGKGTTALLTTCHLIQETRFSQGTAATRRNN